jgi:hypothetical protein
MNNQSTRVRINAAPALWASAFGILAMIITQAGRFAGGPSSAVAGIESSVGDLTVLTAFGEANQDILLVLDRRAESVLIYGVNSRGKLEMLEADSLSTMFQSARTASGGSRRP